MVQVLINTYNRVLSAGDKVLLEIQSAAPAPPAPIQEIQLVISGMAGANWNGLGNGTHNLDGTEALLESFFHAWYMYGTAYTVGASDSLRFKIGSPLSTARIYYNGSGSFITFNASTFTLSPFPSIGNRLMGSKIINGVTFTWSKGTDWVRGGM